MILSNLREILKRLLLLLTFYSVVRAFFIVYNWKLFIDLPATEVVTAFLYGLRFDVSALLFLNLPFILLWLTPLAKNRLINNLLFYLFWGLNSALIALNVVDMELIHFTGKRMSFEFFKLTGDWTQQSVQLIAHYWKLSGLSFILAVLLFFLLNKVKNSTFPKVSFKNSPVFVLNYFIFIALMVIGLRGGLQLKPLNTAQAYQFSHMHMGVFTLNTTFTIIKSSNQKQAKRFKFFKSKDLLKNNINSALVDVQFPLVPEVKNIVIIILESFALEFMGVTNDYKGYTPFMDQLAQKGLFFENAFANGRRSIEAIPSILCGLPSLGEEPFITSSYQSNEIYGLGNVLKKRGYHTSFFHGAENGTMYFDAFSKRVGFDNYFGLDEYPERGKHFDGSWGIYDEPFFQFSLKQLSKVKGPFVSVLFSLSSHQPYSIPPELKGNFPKGTLEIHESIGYTDFALKKFFESASKEPWYNETLFVITADHTQKSDQLKYRDDLGPYRVPLLFYFPGGELPKVNPLRVVQHVDILPSIYHILGVKSEKLNLFGTSIFQKASEGRAYNRTHAKYWYLNDKGYLTFSSSGDFLEYKKHQSNMNFNKDENIEKELSASRLRAVLQYFTDGLTENNWYHL